MSLRLYALISRVLLQDIYQQAVTEFLDHRLTLKATGSTPQYFANPKNQPKMNIRLPERLSDRATEAARDDQRSIAQLLYTALCRFAEQHPVQMPGAKPEQPEKKPTGRRKK